MESNLEKVKKHFEKKPKTINNFYKEIISSFVALMLDYPESTVSTGSEEKK